jgi:UDP-2,4-diacetamido-2,4,6-trideoxy-beta-L-idose 2-epimerase
MTVAGRAPHTFGVVTGTRADYGLLRWLLHEMRKDPSIDLRLIACGAHLSPEFGLTVREIEADGFAVDERVEMLLSSDTSVGTAKSLALGTIGIAEALDRLNPSMIILVGDRFETLAAAQAALVTRIPVAHIGGGEITEGAYDDAIRHAVTKMAHLHFVSTEPYRRRVLQLGEDPARVFVVGAPGIEHLRRTPSMSRGDLARELGFDLDPAYVLVTYHPETLGELDPGEAVEELFAALDLFPGLQIVMTYPNSDTSGRQIIERIEVYARAHPTRVFAAPSLGQSRFVSALRGAAAVIGNSSSGIIEAPAIPVATVNIGDRQAGRLRTPSIIDCAEDAASIHAAITQALDPGFLRSRAGFVHPYGDGRTAQLIVKVLRTIEPATLRRKRFHDIPGAGDSA